MMKKSELNRIKNNLFEQLDIVIKDNNKLRYTNSGDVIHQDAFEDKDSTLGWYIYWGENIENIVDEEDYEIRAFSTKNNSKKYLFEKMLESLDYPIHPKNELSNSIVAAITDINNNPIAIERNLKSEENTSKKHAEQLCLEKIKNINLPIRKLKIYVSLIPCIECFKKIYANDSIEEIIYLKDYRTSLVLTEHNAYTKNKNKNKRRDYSITMQSLKTATTRRICYHHDAYIIKTRVTDILDKKWFKEVSDLDSAKIEISEINYNDFEKLTIMIKYFSKEIINIEGKSGFLNINPKEFSEELKKFCNLYKKGHAYKNRLVNLLEEISNN